ncbi:hypothetical protein GCM10023340_17220 [Nocardioides marinquilinus]|uniref:Uncharacterized protein n=1 Tax=Nocardioides marinquilinus TaxID=1210400 RepID=A0ABP9PLN0_9ACTN
MPETFDLDRAFDDLARDVADTSCGRGADRAVASSRRRRAVGVGAGAVAALAAVAVCVPLLTGGGGTATDPAGPSPTTPPPTAPPPEAPAPAPLTAESLSAATAPWVDGWREGGSPVLTDGPCLSAGRAEPRAEGATELRAGQVGAGRVYSVWEDAAQARDVGDRIVTGFAACADGPMAATAVDVPGASVIAYDYPDGSGADGTLWLAVTGDRVGLLTIVGVDTPPADVLDAVGTALVADLASDEG